jgi:hypothetical protein
MSGRRGGGARSRHSGRLQWPDASPVSGLDKVGPPTAIQPDHAVARCTQGVSERFGHRERALGGTVARSVLYDWKNGAHLPSDTRPLLEVVKLCPAGARQRAKFPQLTG